jgi:valyl-tRNA synthetase
MALTNYSFKENEEKWIKKWEEKKVYKYDSKIDKKDSYVIDTPPPTVSGSLHMGHIFSYTHTDIIARFKRMTGKNIYYPMGFDDNGLPTERLVEKKNSVKATKMDRPSFVDLCKKTIVEEEEKFRNLFKKIGLSVDWSVEYQTISDDTKFISQSSFLDLIEKGHIYRKDQPMLWDVVDQTALAQAEIEDKEFESHMNYIIFKCDDGKQTPLHIATTRPEMLPACVAVFYNPNDERYKNLKNSYAVTPLFNVRVPILPDEKVSIEKGTGLVMCCTFGDATDIMWWKENNLPLKKIISKDGKIVCDEKFDSESANNFVSQVVGLKIKEARETIISILKSENLLTKQEKIVQTVKCAERSGSPLEILSTPQWFIKTIDKKDRMLELSAEVNWYPKSMKIKLDSWINSISWDWCISRQRFFGVPVPVWYSKRAGEEGRVLLPNVSQLPIDPLVDLPEGYSREEIEADRDVFDTWATSALTPQINARKISEKYALNNSRDIFPADLRPQAHEIIRVWAFGTILKSELHSKVLPWENIMISGWCLSEDKTKMSKSKGNTVTPESLIEKYGTDVIRYWAASARLGNDYAYSEDMMLQGKKFVNKLINSAKFASINFGILDDKGIKLEDLIENGTIYHTIDLWLIDKLSKVISSSQKHLDEYEYSLAKDSIEEFFLRDFCDNYIEIVKTRSYDESDKKSQLSCVYTMYNSLKIILALLAPFVPFVTEEIYNSLYNNNNDDISIHEKGNWPNLLIKIDDNLIEEGNKCVEVLDFVRKYKSDKQISIKTQVNEIVLPFEFAVSVLGDLRNVTNSQSISVDKNSEFIKINM